MPEDKFQHATDSVTAPAQSCAAITPSDLGPLPQVTKAIYVGTGGDIVLRAASDDADILFANVPAGTVLPVRVRAVRMAGTTAGQLVALL